MLKAANNAQSTLAQAITATATSFNVVDGSSFPTDNFLLSVDDEIMLVGARSGNTFSSVTRGHEGTTAAAHVSGTAVENRFTAGTHMELVEAIGNNAKYKNGSGTFTANGTTYTVTDAFITANTLVIVSPTSEKLGSWTVASTNGSFTITSDATETTAVTFDWGAMK